jgi:hypothetical protein
MSLLQPDWCHLVETCTCVVSFHTHTLLHLGPCLLHQGQAATGCRMAVCWVTHTAVQYACSLLYMCGSMLCASSTRRHPFIRPNLLPTTQCVSCQESFAFLPGGVQSDVQFCVPCRLHAVFAAVAWSDVSRACCLCCTQPVSFCVCCVLPLVLVWDYCPELVNPPFHADPAKSHACASCCGFRAGCCRPDARVHTHKYYFTSTSYVHTPHRVRLWGHLEFHSSGSHSLLGTPYSVVAEVVICSRACISSGQAGAVLPLVCGFAVTLVALPVML